jgi:predicted Zn-dependent peptidase
MTYELTTLPSGLRVATEFLPARESLTIAVSVDVGARHEETGEGGLSHLLEHMAFKGTKRRSARAIAEEMDMVGGHMNAYTSLENTVYYTRVLARDTEFAVDLLSDIIQHSVFDEDELAREREVILQEIAMHYDTPDDLIHDYFSAVAYPDQPLGRSILGTPEQIKAYRSEQVEAYLRKHYTASRLVVSAAGKVDHASFALLAEKHFGALPVAAERAPAPARYEGGEMRVKRKLEQLHVMLGVPAVAFVHPDYYRWQVLATLLGGGMSSRLFQEVREKRGLAYTVQAYLASQADTGMLTIYAATGEEKGAELLPVLCQEIAQLAEGVSETEVQRAKNQIIASLLMSRESSSSIAEWIGRHLLCYGRYKPATELAEQVESITSSDIQRLAQSFAEKPRLTLATLGPHKHLPDYDALRNMLAA